ncbi:hypothetical protein HaLaN_01849, partial [Haematococcus lacustris]
MARNQFHGATDVAQLLTPANAKRLRADGVWAPQLQQTLIAFLEQYAEASGPFKWSRLGKFLFTNLLPGSSPALAKADFAVEEEGEEADEHVTASPRKAMSGPAQHLFGKVQPVFNTPTKDGAKPTECSQATAGLAQQPFRIVQPVFTTPTKDAAKPEECSQLLLSDEGHGAEVERMAKKRDPLAEDADWRQLADNLTLALGCVAAEPV